jgi:hypothetical protein
MSRYYFHLRNFAGSLIEDEEGSDLRSLAAAKQQALRAMQELVGDALKQGEEAPCEAIIVADERGSHLAAVPVLAALPPTIVNLLKQPEKVVPTNRIEEYRRYAEECRGKAEEATDPDDKMSWLKLADAWLHMLPQSALPEGWPKASEEHSKASH